MHQSTHRQPAWMREALLFENQNARHFFSCPSNRLELCCCLKKTKQKTPKISKQLLSSMERKIAFVLQTRDTTEVIPAIGKPL